jgi:hypothetical protein
MLSVMSISQFGCQVANISQIIMKRHKAPRVLPVSLSRLVEKGRNEQVRIFPSSKTLWASQGNHGNTSNLTVICVPGTAVIMVHTNNKRDISERKTHKYK